MQRSAKTLLLILGIVSFTAGCASTPTQPQPSANQAAETRAAKPSEKAAPSATSTSMMSYNVVRGDHLWGIASKPSIYGNPYQWPLIFKANRDKIKDADLIEPGQLFTIEKNPAQADIDAAVQHAKTRGEWTLGVAEKSDLDYVAMSGTKTAGSNN